MLLSVRFAGLVGSRSCLWLEIGPVEQQSIGRLPGLIYLFPISAFTIDTLMPAMARHAAVSRHCRGSATEQALYQPIDHLRAFSPMLTEGWLESGCDQLLPRLEGVGLARRHAARLLPAIGVMANWAGGWWCFKLTIRRLRLSLRHDDR